MRTIEHSLDIAAPAAAVWRVLTDFDAYPEWNPLLRIAGRAENVGDKLSVEVRPVGAKALRFSPKIVELEPERALVWLGRVILPGIVDGRHEFRLEPLPDARCRFTQREVFRGILVPVLGKVATATQAGFVAMNEALAARVAEAAPGQ